MTSKRLWLGFMLVFALALEIPEAFGATRNVDLDGQTANGAESACELNVLQTFPVQIENRVTNRAIGEAFAFDWPSAGPGGFASSVTTGTAGGVGAKWVWTTMQTVYSYTGNSCANDVCFGQTEGTNPVLKVCSLSCVADGAALSVAKGTAAGEIVLSWTGGQGPYTVYRSATAARILDPVNAVRTTDLQQLSDIPPSGSVFFYLVRGVDCAARKTCGSDLDCDPVTEGTCVNRGPFGVPGRSLSTNNVTVSSATLTSSLITFFSPPREVFAVKSTAQPGGLLETVTNNSTSSISAVIAAYPPGCCPANPDILHPLRCGETCVDYLNDPENCGACGNVCGEGTCCSNGSCESLCEPGRVWCDGLCVDLRNDSSNCGGCGNGCESGTCCSDGVCASLCAEGDTWCDPADVCADTRDDSANCGACGNVCESGTCCSNGGCESVCGGGRTWCNEQCADFLNDSANCGACGESCGAGACCSNGACVTACAAGRTLCADDLCYDLQNDPGNCGACGHVCGEDSVCAGGVCVECDGHGGARDACDNRCVNIRTDPYNCGGCGISCNEDCPSDFHGVCSNGQSCTCVAGAPAPQPPSNIPPPTAPECPNTNPSSPVDGVCPNPDPSPGPVLGTCPNGSPTWPVPGVCPGPDPSAPPPLEPTPICQVDARTTPPIPPGGSVTTCLAGGLVFKEVPGVVRVCGDGLPGPDGACGDGISHVSQGSFMRLVPDTGVTVDGVYLTPYAIRVTGDTSNDGLLQPGERAQLIVEVLNSGPVDLTAAGATLVAPVVDLTDDGISNPVGLVLTTAASSYGTLRATLPSANCAPVDLAPVANATAFDLTVPADHPGDTSHPIALHFNGIANGSPFSMDVPMSLGIADRCDPAAGTRDFDGLDGLLSPMEKLVPAGDPAPFPTRDFSAGNTRPLKLRMLCGDDPLTDGEVDPPQIVGLSKEGYGPMDIGVLSLNADNSPNPNDPFFRFSSSQSGGSWIYNMRTSLMGTGRFTLTIRIAGRKDYVSGFVLR